MVDYRPYQKEAIDKIHKEWDEGKSKTLLVLPTGTGKTVVFSKVIANQVNKGERCLILAHRSELLEQARDKLEKTTGLRASLEKAEESSLGKPYRVTVGSVQTLQNIKRLSKFDKNHFGAIVIDEAHHVLSQSYQNVLNYFDGAKVLGVTATPDRGDMKNLGQVFESLAYEYSLPQAIKDGFLCPIRAQTIPIKLDLNGVKTQAGDFKAQDIGDALEPYLEKIADEMLYYAKDRKIVVFLPLVATSQKFCALLNKRGFQAAEVNGNSVDRKAILEDFENGRYNVLCNSMLLTEGWDCPSVDCVIVLRPTKVRSLYAQMVGRGTRLSKGKEYLLLLDFLWHSEKNELCRPACLICADKDTSDKVTAKLEKTAGQSACDLSELEADSAQEVVADREASLVAKLAEMKKRKRQLVDVLQYEFSIEAEDLINYQPTFAWEQAPATAKQLERLNKWGIHEEAVENAGKASLLLDRLTSRAANGLTSPKQIRFLERQGFQHVGRWTFDQASYMINRIAAGGWKVPHSVNPATYQPSEVRL